MRIFNILTLVLLPLANCFSQSISSLTPNNFEIAIKNKKIQLLDVRTIEEYNSGHIKEALQADWNNTKEFNERISALDKSKPVYLYCLAGARSGQAAKFLLEKGFTGIYDLKGGINAWKTNNKPIDGIRNVKQITIGDYNKMITNSITILVDFSAEWCPPCKKMIPIITELKRQESGKYKIINIDAGSQTDIMKLLHIDALPIFIVYKNGKEVWRNQGITTKEELKKHLL